MILGRKGEYSKKYYYVYGRHVYRYDCKIVDVVVKNAPFRSRGEIDFLARLRAKAMGINDIEGIKELILDQERWEANAEIKSKIFRNAYAENKAKKERAQNGK